MKRTALFLLVYSAAISADQYMHPTVPGTSIRDYSRPGYVIESGPNPGTGTSYGGWEAPAPSSAPPAVLYPTIPGTSIRDYSAPGYQIERY